MIFNEIMELVQKGKISVAEKELKRRNFSHSSNYKLLMSLINKYNGEIEESLKFAQESLIISEKKQNNFINITSKMLIINAFLEIGNISEAKEIFLKLNTVQSLIISYIISSSQFWIALYKQIQGMFEEINGQYKDAIYLYEEALSIFHENENLYELMNTNYKIGSVYRKLGLLEESESSIKKSLEIAKILGKKLAIAIYLNKNGELLLYKDNKEESLSYFEQALPIWQDLNLNFGLAWILHDLGIVYQLRGEYKKALTLLEQVYIMMKAQYSIAYKTKALLAILVVSLDIHDDNKAQEIYQELENIINKDSQYHTLLKIAKGMLLKNSTRISHKMKAQEIFAHLSTEENIEFEFKAKALINYLELILFEIELAKDMSLTDEITTLVDKLQAYADKSYELYVYSSLLRAKIELLMQNTREANNILENALVVSKKYGLSGLESRIVQESTLFSLLLSKFSGKPIKVIDKTLHSIPRLNILLYLLPRKLATFSELQKATQISDGNLYGHCQKLEDRKYIQTQKVFIKAKLTTIYTLTDDGIEAYENYTKSLTHFLNNELFKI